MARDSRNSAGIPQENRSTRCSSRQRLPREPVTGALENSGGRSIGGRKTRVLLTGRCRCLPVVRRQFGSGGTPWLRGSVPGPRAQPCSRHMDRQELFTVVVRPVARTPTPEVLLRRRDRPSLCGDDAVRQDCTRRLDGSQKGCQPRRPTRSAKASSASMTSWAIHARLRRPPPARLTMPASSSCSTARWAAESATPVTASA